MADAVVQSFFKVLELKIGSLESEKIIIKSLVSEKWGPYRAPNIFLKKNCCSAVFFNRGFAETDPTFDTSITA